LKEGFLVSTPFRLRLPRQFYDEMVSQARAELPNECCGLLAGVVTSDGASPPDASLRVAQVRQRYPLVNAAGSPKEYHSESRGMFEAVRDMRRQELEVLAVYHSHPTSEAVPSRTDLARNYSPDVVNFIISLKSAEAVVRAWWLTAEDYRPADWDLC
jgi:proteasome lid subunit RPN8/RPN11